MEPPFCQAKEITDSVENHQPFRNGAAWPAPVMSLARHLPGPIRAQRANWKVAKYVARSVVKANYVLVTMAGHFKNSIFILSCC